MRALDYFFFQSVQSDKSLSLSTLFFFYRRRFGETPQKDLKDWPYEFTDLGPDGIGRDFLDETELTLNEHRHEVLTMYRVIALYTSKFIIV